MRLTLIMLSKMTVIALMCLKFIPPNALQAQSAYTVLNDISWNSNGSLLALGYNDGLLQIVDRDGQIVLESELGVSGRRIDSVAWNPIVINQLAVASENSSIKILTFENDGFTLDFEIQSPFNSIRLLDWNITGTELAFAGETGGGASSESWIEIWNIPTRQQQFIYDNGYIITDLRWSPADPHLLALTGVVNNFGNEVVVVDIETGRPRWRVIDVSAGVAYLDWDQSASRLGIVVNRQLQGRVEIRNAENGLLITSLLNGSERVTGIDWSPSAFFVVTGGQQGVIRAGDTYEVVYQLEDASLVRWSNQGDIAYRVSSQEVRITQALAAIKIPTVTP